VPASRNRTEAAPSRPPRGAAPSRNLRRQGEATRSKLLAAAVPALADKGYHATRVDDVVRLAGVSHGTFYLYFANKEDLFRGLAAECADEAAELAAALGSVLAGPDGREVLREWLEAFLDFYRRHGVVIRAWTENQVSDRKLAKLGVTSFGRIAETLRDAVASTPGDPSRADELRSAALLALVERFAYVATSRDLGFDDAVLLDNLATFVHRGWFAAPA
jgi:AcrR family transcriptional regulator